MDRVAHLIKTAEDTRRKLWASLPFDFRYAEVLYRLGSSAAADAFGTGIYQLFIQQGVQGMPDIGGKPADSYEGRRLPGSYGRAFGKKVFAILMSKHRNSAVVEDIMSAVLVYFMEKPDRISGKFKLKSAESFVIQKADWDGLSMIRRKNKRVEVQDSPSRDDEGEYGPGYIDVAPSQDKKRYTLEEAVTYILSRHDVKNALERVHPSAEQYVRLSLDGYSDKQILGDPAKGIPCMLDFQRMSTAPNAGKIYPPAWRRKKLEISQVLNDAYGKLEAMDVVPELMGGILNVAV
jgi:hypothetical protein